jgi:ferredoxin
MNVKMKDVVYKMVYPYYARYLNKRININDECINCKICEKNCPVKSIKITDEAKFDDNCTLCQRCLCKCPKNAFTYKGNEIIQYNPNFRTAKKALDEKI